MSTNRSPRYSAMLSLDPRVGHFVRSGANLASRRGTGKLPTRPDQFACRNSASSFHLITFIPGAISIEAGGLCGWIERACDEWSAGAHSSFRPVCWFEDDGGSGLLLASANRQGCAGSKTRKMEPQNTQNTQMDTGEDRANLLSKRIIGGALTVLHELGSGFLENAWRTSSASLGSPSRNNIPWPFDTMGSRWGNILLTYSSKTSSSSN